MRHPAISHPSLPLPCIPGPPTGSGPSLSLIGPFIRDDHGRIFGLRMWMSFVKGSRSVRRLVRDSRLFETIRYRYLQERRKTKTTTTRVHSFLRVHTYGASGARYWKGITLCLKRGAFPFRSRLASSDGDSLPWQVDTSYISLIMQLCNLLLNAEAYSLPLEMEVPDQGFKSRIFTYHNKKRFVWVVPDFSELVQERG